MTLYVIGMQDAGRCHIADWVQRRVCGFKAIGISFCLLLDQTKCSCFSEFRRRLTDLRFITGSLHT